MKEIKNWEAVIKNEEGNEQIALPLPGCIIKGEVGQQTIEVEAINVDISNLIISDNEGSMYLLTGANKEYIKDISACIQYEKNERDGEER